MRAPLPLLLRALVSGALVATAALAPAVASTGRDSRSHAGHVSGHQRHWSQHRIQARLDRALKSAPHHWQVSPGVSYREWTTTDSEGQPQRIHVLDVNPKVPGVSLDYLANAHLRDRLPASRMLDGPTTVGGTNANFFDISDTGSPNGIGYNRSRGLLHAPSYGWNNAFFQTTDGAYHIGTLGLVARINEYPTWSVTGLNTSNVKQDSMTVFTPSWGKTAGASVLNGPHGQVREVDVVNGAVTYNSDVLHSGSPITGLMLVGRGQAAAELATLPVGTPLSVSWSLDQPVEMAVTGNQVLVRGGQDVAPSDGLHAPRTAVGITSSGHILLVSVDGRMESAAGMTLPALGALLIGLGVTDALNFDGGGSSTMMASSYRWTRQPSLVNLPSEGTLRDVPDVLAVDYSPPVG